MKKIMDLRGWNMEHLENELNKRKDVLKWMLDNNIRSYRDVGKIISDYTKNPSILLKKLSMEAI